MLKLAGIVASTLLISISSASAACIVQRFNFQFGSNTSTVMALTNGGWCRITLNAGSTSIFESLVSVAQPKNGKLSIPSKSQFIYTVNKGFKGTDSFAVRVTGHGSQLSGPSTISVSVTSD